MNNLSFDEGLKELSINGDSNRIIRFNPCDPSITDRIEKAEKNIKDIEKNPDKQYIEKSIKEQINFILNADCADIIFGATSPLAICSGGKFLFENVITAIVGYINSEMEKELKKTKKNVEKYVKQVKKWLAFYQNR